MSDIKNKIKIFIRLLLGVYTANDYIRLGRYLSRGGQMDFLKRNLSRLVLYTILKYRTLEQ